MAPRATVCAPVRQTPCYGMVSFPLLKMIKATACEAYGRHCGSSGEYNHNVFNRPSNTLPVCETDASGNFGSGTLDASSNDGVEYVVNFEYQVQTTLSQTVARLNSENSPLQEIEKAISDAVVEGLFSGSQCTVPAVIKSGDNTRRRQRYLQSYSDQLSGLRTEPMDEVLPGSAGGALILYLRNMWDFALFVVVRLTGCFW